MGWKFGTEHNGRFLKNGMIMEVSESSRSEEQKKIFLQKSHFDGMKSPPQLIYKIRQ